MPNTFIDNKEAWLRMADIDYLGQFVKVWLAFNAWYRNAYSEHQDRKIVNELKWNSNPIGNALRPLLENSSEEAEQFRSDIGLLHHRLEHYEINTGKDESKQRITFRKIFLRDRLARIEREDSYGCAFTVELKPNGHIESIVLNKTGSTVLSLLQVKHDISDLISHRDFMSLRVNQQNSLKLAYERAAPKEIVDLLSTGRTTNQIECGSFKFYCTRDELFAALVEVIYLMRCHLFHGELSPTKQAGDCYESAYRVVKRFLLLLS